MSEQSGREPEPSDDAKTLYQFACRSSSTTSIDLRRQLHEYARCRSGRLWAEVPLWSQGKGSTSASSRCGSRSIVRRRPEDDEQATDSAIVLVKEALCRIGSLRRTTRPA